MLEEKINYKIEIDLGNYTISIGRVSTILNNGVQISQSIHRQAFVPGQIEDVKTFMSYDDSNVTIIYLNALWTQDVIDAYNAMIAAQQNP